MTLFLLLVHHPEVQIHAHTEIMSVVGSDRLPHLSDRDSLPYIDSIIQETLRFNPPVPLVTHSNWKDDTYDGYRIPRKTWVMGNVWYVSPLFDLVVADCELGLCCMTKWSILRPQSFGLRDSCRRTGMHHLVILAPLSTVLGDGEFSRVGH